MNLQVGLTAKGDKLQTLRFHSGLFCGILIRVRGLGLGVSANRRLYMGYAKVGSSCVRAPATEGL